MAKATLSDPTLKDLNVVDFMNSWTKQAGYPVVKVNRNYATGKIEFEQVRFVLSNKRLMYKFRRDLFKFIRNMRHLITKNMIE